MLALYILGMILFGIPVAAIIALTLGKKKVAKTLFFIFIALLLIGFSTCAIIVWSY